MLDSFIDVLYSLISWRGERRKANQLVRRGKLSRAQEDATTKGVGVIDADRSIVLKVDDEGPFLERQGETVKIRLSDRDVRCYVRSGMASLKGLR